MGKECTVVVSISNKSTDYMSIRMTHIFKNILQ